MEPGGESEQHSIFVGLLFFCFSSGAHDEFNGSSLDQNWLFLNFCSRGICLERSIQDWVTLDDPRMAMSTKAAILVLH